MGRPIETAPNGDHFVREGTGRRPLFMYSHPNASGDRVYDLQAYNLDELKAAHEDIAAYLGKHGIDVSPAPEEPAFEPEYVAEALRNTLRATSFEGGVDDDLVEDFIASYEHAVEEGGRL